MPSIIYTFLYEVNIFFFFLGGGGGGGVGGGRGNQYIQLAKLLYLIADLRGGR